MARRRAARAAEALESLIGSLEGGIRVRESLAIAYWPDAVGPQAAAASRAETVRDGVLVVRTRSSAWSQELSLLSETIVTALNARIGRPVIKRLRFTATGIPPADVPEPPLPHPSTHDLAAIRLSPSELAHLRRSVGRLSTVRDSRLRSAAERTLAQAWRLRAWRLEHGWRVCAACDAAHALPGPLCPVCRSEGR